jgi:hypothetical protein
LARARRASLQRDYVIRRWTCCRGAARASGAAATEHEEGTARLRVREPSASRRRREPLCLGSGSGNVSI